MLVILTSRCFIVPGSYANQRQTRDKNSISHCSGVGKSMLSIPRAHTTRRQPLGYPSHPVAATGHLSQLPTHNTPHWRAHWALCASIRRATESCRPTGIRAPARSWTPRITCCRSGQPRSRTRTCGDRTWRTFPTIARSSRYEKSRIVCPQVGQNASRAPLTVSRLGIEYNPRNDDQRLGSFLSTTAIIVFRVLRVLKLAG